MWVAIDFCMLTTNGQLGYEEEKVWGRQWVPPSDALEVNQRPGQASGSPGPPKLPVAYKPTNVVRRTATGTHIFQLLQQHDY